MTTRNHEALYVDVKHGVDREPSAKKPAPSRTAVEKKPVTDYALRTAKELKPTRSVVYKAGAGYSRELRLYEPEPLPRQ